MRVPHRRYRTLAKSVGREKAENGCGEVGRVRKQAWGREIEFDGAGTGAGTGAGDWRRTCPVRGWLTTGQDTHLWWCLLVSNAGQALPASLLLPCSYIRGAGRLSHGLGGLASAQLFGWHIIDFEPLFLSLMSMRHRWEISLHASTSATSRSMYESHRDQRRRTVRSPSETTQALASRLKAKRCSRVGSRDSP